MRAGSSPLSRPVAGDRRAFVGNLYAYFGVTAICLAFLQVSAMCPASHQDESSTTGGRCVSRIGREKGQTMNLPFTVRTQAALAASAFSLLCSLPFSAHALPVMPPPQVQLVEGIVAGDRAYVGVKQLNVFRGIPFAAPPTESNRWREPQRLAPWAGVREAKRFAPRCMQGDLPGLTFRSTSMSEDCLYLNVWAPTPAKPGNLPVLVYFHGGGFAYGDGSEPRYDGAHLAARGMIVVTVNYRLGAFGFMSHPDAARESSTGGAGNYGLLDQQAALRWVRDNIAQFGGDPRQVTIGGETTGATAVSAHMASPLSRGLFARAIGESGGAFTPNAFWRRARGERVAQAFAQRVGAQSLDALRSMSAEKLQDAMGPRENPAPFFWPTVDGYFLTDTPAAVFEAGGQAPVPLLLGSNSQESHFKNVLGPIAPTPENWSIILGTVFGKELAEARTFYPGNNADEITNSASLLANDLTVSHSTWRWMDLHRKTGRAPVYFYLFTHQRPPATEEARQAGLNEEPQPGTGAPHRSEIVYALDNLQEDRRYAWTTEDRKVAYAFSGYIEQFVKSGTPNRAVEGQSRLLATRFALSDRVLPYWPAVRQAHGGLARQVIELRTETTWDDGAARQALVERVLHARPGN